MFMHCRPNDRLTMPYRTIRTATTAPTTVPPADDVPRVLPVTVNADEDC